MTELSVPLHGVLRHIREILAAGEALHNTSVRVLGRCALLAVARGLLLTGCAAL